MENNNYIENTNKRLEIILNDDVKNLRIGDNAPRFTANTTLGPIKLTDYMDKWLILFSHPGDFTPVCTTEMIAFAKTNPEFEKRNCQLVGLSIDSNPSHLSWVHNIHKTTGIQLPFPIIADIDMRISKMYGMIAPNQSTTQTVRNVFFIDPKQKIRAILQYPMQNGRNINEITRLLDAMQTTDKDNVVTPANWIPGNPTIVPPPTTYDQLLERINNPLGYNCMDWYLCFNQKNDPITNINDKNYMMSKNIYNNGILKNI